MIELLNLALAGGLGAAAAPLIVHIAHRRRYRPVWWGAMRFLTDMLAARRRRLFIEQFLLLIVRMGILLCLGLALCRPSLDFARAGSALVRTGRVAAVILIDDSLTTMAGRGRPVFDDMKTLAKAYLSTLQSGDEVSIIRASRLGTPPGDPLLDIEAAQTMIGAMDPTAVASNTPALLEAGLAQLARHVNPDAELVLVDNGDKGGLGLDQSLRWQDLRRRLLGPSDAIPGSRSRPNLLVLTPRPRAVDYNVAVTGLRLDRSLIPAGRLVGVHVEVTHVGSIAPPDMLLRLSVNGRAVDQRVLHVGGASTQEVVFDHAFPEAGSYVVEAAIEGAHDLLPLDDHRCLSVAVERQVPVLLVEGQAANGLGGSLGLAGAALDPDGTGSELFQPARISATGIDSTDLSHYRVIILGDLPALSADEVASIERFVVAGGGLLVCAGPHTDMDIANRFWSRSGDGFLPCNIAGIGGSGDPASPHVQHPATAALDHPVFNAFTDHAQDAWKDGRVWRYWRLDPATAHDHAIENLLVLDNGDPLLIERQRGAGRVAFMTSGLDASWNDLPYHAAYVPLVRGLVAWLGSTLLPPRNLRSGERLTYCPVAAKADHGATTLQGPDGNDLPLVLGTWESRPALVSPPLLVPGTYVVQEPSAVAATRFAVAVDPRESRLETMSADDIADLFRDLGPHVLHTPDQIRSACSNTSRRSFEVWRYLVLAGIGLLMVETALTRNQVRPGPKGPPIPADPVRERS